jgi:GTP-binding protein
MQVEFITSAVEVGGFPRDPMPEVAFAGRSNVGKSSLINALVGRKVARTSAAPGKTRLANFFRVAREGAPLFRLVDLPGYGYARGGEASKREFATITSAYFDSRSRDKGALPFLAAVLLLVDSRHPGLPADTHASGWLQRMGVRRVVVATKVDKLTRAERVRHVKELERLHDGPVVGVSAQTGEGLKDLWKTIDALLRP